MKSILLLLISFSAFGSPVEYKNEYKFERNVPSKMLKVECDALPGEERGPFGLIYEEGYFTHEFLVMTGVYYDTCKTLEKKIKELKRKHNRLIVFGTENRLYQKGNLVWRWRSVRTTDGKHCISYFSNDCDNDPEFKRSKFH